jgi:16S rRNA (cytidine1402-2'-O)-methyltransferase
MMASQQPGTLYLIPCVIADESPEVSIPSHVRGILIRLTHFLVENEKSFRRFYKVVHRQGDPRSLHTERLNEHTRAEELPRLLAPLREGIDVGILSEAGCPAIADPGAAAVRAAHAMGATVAPLVGPSSILLALMGSGMSGQNFHFVGYLPTDSEQRRKALVTRERESLREHSAIVFIETPYRNEAVFADVLAVCAESTLLCVAHDILGAQQSITTRSIAHWKSACPAAPIHSPTVFVLTAN